MTTPVWETHERWTLPTYGISFNTGIADETGCTYWCTSDSGWRGGAAPRTNRDAKASGMGDYRRAATLAGLVCSLEGRFFGPTPLARALAERKLAKIGKDTRELFEVRCMDSAGELFSMMELDAQTLADPAAMKNGVFSLQFASQDPRRYTVGQTTGGTTGLASSTGGLDWVTGGGLDWVTGGGLNWGTVTSTGQLTFVNAGTAETDPVFTITLSSGTLVNPVITFMTGQRLRYFGTLLANDSLRIDTSQFTRSAILNGGTDVRTRLDIAEWFQLPVGSSWVIFSADNANAAAILAGSAYNAYW